MKKFALVLAASALTAVAAFAEDAAPAAEVVDTDANGTFSLAEVQAVYAAVTEETFKAADTDASGELSAEELKAAVDAGAFAA
ncbi:EF-hand domain-containing protein [Tabrizicola soli]|uniref:EF-hand domain-containing protein n=1 Tax=Tabrizicola soli TaxID=2185115 RepID=A0ABV7DU79_9RHOB|nr:EF-hand domain-containing protein [Tabrizicola soli]